MRVFRMYAHFNSFAKSWQCSKLKPKYISYLVYKQLLSSSQKHEI